MRTLSNVFQLGLKELRSMYRDPALLVLIVYAFTLVSQAFTGAGHIQQIINDEVTAFVKRYRANTALPVEAVVRTAFNPNLTRS